MERSAEFFCPSKTAVARCSALAWLICCSAHGNEADPLDEIQVTATRERIAAHDVPVALTVIARDELRRHTPLTAADHLRGEPGTYVQQTTPGQGVPIIRGLKGSEVLHLVDGFRLNNAIFRNAPSQYVALVDPWNLQRIEVVRGAAAALHGGEAMGGVVQFLTRKPQFDGAATQARGKAGVQLGSSDSRKSAQLEGEFGNERWLVHMGASWQEVDELRVGGGESLPFTEFSSRGAHAGFTLHTSPDQMLQFQVQLTEQPQTPRYDALAPGFGQNRPDFSEHRFAPQRREFGQVRWLSEQPTPVWDSADFQVGMQRIVDDRVTRDYEAPFRQIEHNSSSLVGATGNFVLGVGESHSVSYGFEIYHDTVESERELMELSSGAMIDRPGRFPDGSTMQWIGVYAADRWSFTPRFDLTAGVRFTSYQIELPPVINNIGVRMSPQDVSGNLGALFRLTDTFNIVANLGRGFRPPNVFDLGTFGARGNRFNIPNSDLEPESVVTSDLGFKYASNQWRAEVMAFHSAYRDKITQVLTGETDADGRLIVQSRNATRLTLEGVEAGAMWHIGTRASLYATATWTRGEEELDGDSYPADRVPPLFGRFAARIPIADTWMLEPFFYWAAAQRRLSPRDEIDARMNPEGTDGWIAPGLRAHWQPSEALTVFFGLENISDRNYREHGSGFDAPGRNAFASLEWSF